VGDFSTPLATIDGSYRQKINKEILELNDNIDVPAAHGTFSKIDHILGHKASQQT
jgi:hypothetical protein